MIYEPPRSLPKPVLSVGARAVVITRQNKGHEPMLEKKNPRVLVGITGGIAAYKAPDVVRRLKALGVEVRVVMTRGATEFITPLTLQAVSGEQVHRELLDENAEAGMGHIELAKWADVVLVAPATANFLAALRAGFANDLLTTLCLATDAPIALAPAMNQQMWRAAATKDNVEVLKQRGVRIIGPGEGAQACGDVGPGRMVEPADIVDEVQRLLGSPGRIEAATDEPSIGLEQPLTGVSVLVSAGPTREAIDPVRYISNHSSGKMGYAVAAAAQQLGASVTLVTGPTALMPPPVDVVHVESANEMYEAVIARAPSVDVFVSAAAVADYTPAEVADKKLKKAASEMSVELVKTHDILAAVAALPSPPFTVGFAAETNDMHDNARKKLAAKALDMIAGNDVAQPGIGFNSDENALSVFWEGGNVDLPRTSKATIARQLLTLAAERFHARHSTTHS